jgi:predicted XRE-type DNA-binding protein
MSETSNNLSTARSSLPVTQRPRDRLRDQIRLERALTERVLAAQQRLAAENARRDAALTACDMRVRARIDDLADAMIAYIDTAGVRPERAATVLGLPRSTVSSMIRERRAALRRIDTRTG